MADVASNSMTSTAPTTTTGAAVNKGNSTRVAVYGSLKQGFGNHRLLRESPIVGLSVFFGPFRMYDLGAFPAVVQFTSEEIENAPILCEVYEVTEDVLLQLDLLEGHPDFYKRHKFNLPEWTINTPPSKQAWLYMLPERAVARMPDDAIVSSGVWGDSPEEVDYVRQFIKSGDASNSAA